VVDAGSVGSPATYGTSLATAMELNYRLGRQPTSAEIAEELNLPENNWNVVRETVLANSQPTHSMSEDASSVFTEMIEDPNCRSPEETTFGKYGSGAGDVNGDGYDDLIVGGAGGGYLYYGGPFSLTLARTFQVHVGVSSTPVAGAGDTNGDGSDDIVIGAPENDVAGTNAGSAYVYLMGRYHILAPTAGQTWNVGALKTVSWLGTSPAQVWLSADGGTSYSLLTPSAVGGDEENSLLLRVPHTPTKFARIRVTPMDSEVGGFAQTDSFFTIQTSVALLSLLAAPLPEGGVSVSWQSNPGPEDLAGYRLERSGGGDAWRVVASLTRETTVQDPAGGPGSRYRLFAVNGFGDELLLGETSIAPLKAISAWPLPYRGGSLTVAFASAGGLGVGLGRTEVAIYDVRGRLVRRLTEGSYPQGYHRVVWDGNDGRGNADDPPGHPRERQSPAQGARHRVLHLPGRERGWRKHHGA
jgi:hypothetical protein